jgi:hypothetical protein
MTQVGANTVITYDAANAITLTNVSFQLAWPAVSNSRDLERAAAD